MLNQLMKKIWGKRFFCCLKKFLMTIFMYKLLE